MMKYIGALEAAGATVLAFESFGSYQGDWLAKVEYRGQQGWVQGYFGSCSHCDAFQAEFGYGEEETSDYSLGEDGLYHHVWNNSMPTLMPEEIEQMKAAYQLRLAQFGEQYLNDLFSQEQIEKHYSKLKEEWEVEDEEDQMLTFVKTNSF